jgi:cobalamin biosynthetic protein CobC
MAGTTPWTVHGGRLDAARHAYPDAPAPWIDLSTGISPLAYPLAELAAEDWTRLPEPGSLAELERVAGEAFGAPADAEIVAAAGSEALVRLMPLLRDRSRVAVVAPTYTSHADAWATRHHVRPAASFDDALASDVCVVVSPNNPDGRVVDPDRLGRAAGAATSCGGWLVVDEAFADLEQPGVASALDAWPRGLIVLRSFGKTYGLAGVRLGFAIAHPAIAGELRRSLGDWPVSGPALRIGAHAYADREWRERSAHALRSAVGRLDALVNRAGGRLLGGTLLFRLTEWPDARAVFDRLARAAILARPFTDAPRWLRFGIPADKAAWSRLEIALLENRA